MAQFVSLTSRVVPLLVNDIDTDQIIPARFLKATDKSGMGGHLFADWRYQADGAPRPDFALNQPQHQGAQILLAGDNFGCGSSREHAPVALGAAGVRAVVAESYARIFFRNVVATAEFYPFEAEQRLVDAFKTGDEAELDPAASRIVHARSGRAYSLKPLGAVAPVIQAGGIFEYARQAGMIQRS